MAHRHLLVLTALLLSGSIRPPAPAVDAGFQVVRLGERAAIVQIGRESITNVVVLAGRRGLVVIDTGPLPSRASALRTAIEQAFGRKDFAYVVNTHAHFDHTDGNQAFADVPIVAHASAVRQMTRWYLAPASRDAFIRERGSYQTELERLVASAVPGSKEQARMREEAAENQAVIDDFRQGTLQVTLPTVTFTDRMTLDIGGLTLELSYFGRAHTESDILVHVPEIGLLVVGDLFSKTWLPTFGDRVSDVPRWFQVLGGLPAGDRAVRTVVSGHDAPMTGDELGQQVAYLREVWDGVTAAKRDGLSRAAAEARLPLGPRYAAMATRMTADEVREAHRQNIEAAWRMQSESAAGALEALIGARGRQAAAAEYRVSVAGNDRYCVVESEMIALGYRYLRSGRPLEAVVVFELVAEAFPKSWNAWDSLAEAWEQAGDRTKALAFYLESLEINPRSQSGSENVSRLRGYELDIARQTKVALRFPPGSRTGLRGPYLGQTPPGDTPRVFAPGIVSSAGAVEFSIAFSPDLRELYFTRRPDTGENTLMVATMDRDGWTAPREAVFAAGHASNEPFITPDGRRLYFGSVRPLPGSDRADYGIWVVERAASGQWGEARYHGPGMYVSAARNGNLYMTDITNLAGGGLIVYPWADGRRGAPQRVGGGVNSPRRADHSFVAPDESYILFDSYFRPGGQGGEGDLWVSFRLPDGSWSEALNLGDTINTPATTFCPMVSPDGKYIFYATHKDIYWVSARILDTLRVKARPSASPARGAAASGGAMP